tara:strand:- start:19305 stop:19754 length:450 start_codon:yes stop_codon:yes gene_type:complete
MSKKIIAKNKRASYDFELIERFEAGIELRGTEVKTLRAGKVSLNEAFVTVDKNDEIWIMNMTIPQYEFGNINNHDETRTRKLLMKKDEIQYISHEMSAQRLTIVATIIYFKSSKVKIEIALAKGKKMHDKRADSAKKDIERKLRQGKYD